MLVRPAGNRNFGCALYTKSERTGSLELCDRAFADPNEKFLAAGSEDACFSKQKRDGMTVLRKNFDATNALWLAHFPGVAGTEEFVQVSWAFAGNHFFDLLI
jgi:hypothetical protein